MMSSAGQDLLPDVLDVPITPTGIVTSDFRIEDEAEWGWQRHDAHELLWGTRGSLVVEAPGAVCAVPWTVGLWIPAGVAHRVTAASGTEFACTYLSPGLGPAPRDDVGPVLVSPAVRALLHELGRRNLDPDTRRLAEQVTLRLLDAADVDPLDLPLPDDDRARRVALAVLTDPSDPRGLPEWGGIVGASERNLSRLFRRETGMAFAQWRTRARLRLAVELLSAERSVSDVAHRVGYA